MKLNNWWSNYTYNIKRTHRHKVAYAVDEYKQFGYNTLDCLTHDTDKLLLYTLGFSHDKVVKIHRKISEHHLENSIKKNVKSMFIDIHCSGEKSDKKLPLKDYFYSNSELQKIKGLRELVEAKNFGENVTIGYLKNEVDKVTSSLLDFIKFGITVLSRLKRRNYGK